MIESLEGVYYVEGQSWEQAYQFVNNQRNIVTGEPLIISFRDFEGLVNIGAFGRGMIAEQIVAICSAIQLIKEEK